MVNVLYKISTRNIFLVWKTLFLICFYKKLNTALNMPFTLFRGVFPPLSINTHASTMNRITGPDYVTILLNPDLSTTLTSDTH